MKHLSRSFLAYGEKAEFKIFFDIFSRTQLCNILCYSSQNTFNLNAFMKIHLQIKAAGKRKAILEKHAYHLPETPESLQDFIAMIVTNEVAAYNQKAIDAPLMPYLTTEAYLDGEYVGKIGFNDRKNDAEQALQPAIDNALQALEDGLYRVFINDDEATLDQPFSLPNDATVTFIRLTFLAGRRF